MGIDFGLGFFYLVRNLSTMKNNLSNQEKFERIQKLESELANLYEGFDAEQFNIAPMFEESVEIVIDFTNLEHFLLSIKSLNVYVSKPTLLRVIEIHSSVNMVISFMPVSDCAGICFRGANKILDYLSSETGIKFKRFKKHNYEIY